MQDCLQVFSKVVRGSRFAKKRNKTNLDLSDQTLCPSGHSLYYITYIDVWQGRKGISHERMQSDENSSKLIIVIGGIELVFFGRWQIY